MEVRRISAHYVFPGSSAALKYGIVEFNTEGLIKQVVDTKGEYSESAGLEFYSGIITPGFIISPFLKDLSDLKTDVPEFSLLDNFFSFIGGGMKKGITEDIFESREILKYLILLKEQYPNITLEEQISLVTFKAACALGIQKDYGSLKPGKKPGINLLTHIDLQKLLITDETKVTRIV
jgi:hypothetical protein